MADHCAAKLVRRHPHVFGDVEAADAATVLRNWDAIKRAEPGRGDPFGDLPQNLPATIYARKVQRRAEAAGAPDEVEQPASRLTAALERLGTAEPAPGERFEVVGELLYAAVALARERGVDAELALREAARRRVRHAGERGGTMRPVDD